MNLFKFFKIKKNINLIKNIENEENNNDNNQNENIDKNTHYITYHSNGNIKEKCPLDFKGNLDGFKIIFDNNGNEIEKIQYQNGLETGNPFQFKTKEEIADKLGFEIEDTTIFDDETPDDYLIINKKIASVLLQGSRYYGI